MIRSQELRVKDLRFETDHWDEKGQNFGIQSTRRRPTHRRQLTDVENRVEMSASWSSIQYNLLEVKHTEK